MSNGKFPKRGDVYWIKLDPTLRSEITKTRPCLIVSNNAGNEISSRVIAAPITSAVHKVFPFEVAVIIKGKKGKIVLDQIRTVDKIRIGTKIETIDSEIMEFVDEALKLVLALD